MNDEFVPNWTAIEQSVIWREQIKPWLDALYQDALEEKATGASASIETYHEWRGYCAALKTVRAMPHEMIEINRQLAAQEKEDEMVRAAGADRRTGRQY